MTNKLTSLAAALAVAFIITGCATNVRDITYPDGAREKVSQTAFLQTMQGYAAHGIGLDGTEWDMSVQNLTGDTATVNAVFSGLSSLAGKALLFAAGSNTNLLNVLNSATNGQMIALSASESQKARRYMMLHKTSATPAHR